MKALLSIRCIVLSLFISNICLGQQNESKDQQTQSLGQYYFVMYSKGPYLEQDSATKGKLIREHINYIVSLRKTGQIITGGAFTDKAAWIGFEIYDCKTKEEVIKLTEADPMVLSKIFSYEIHSWTTLKGTIKFE
jgi:uncharacterized protein YciI